ncbi:hypothetical protein QWJ34_09200 [Saccharibacillus sp. CPCC 101409]|uniref:hypothetical protein n=1 Tax=Saccharibacillus sp. CPCC 101409 TaxID=3058041 RepID=UPI0026732C4B|nr:hypothetical protein [Saccharibacillus sp. CPCC 101409]MDO3409938.1 hypothetical protein [Saccharibacillus sp. CPCC 101409]
MSIESNFERFLKEDYFEILNNVKHIKLAENKGIPYEVTLRVSSRENKFLLIKNIEDLKNNDMNYIKEKPKDCDYIIIDLLKQVIFIVELKDTDTTNTELIKQLLAGEKWLDHLLFCCQCDEADLKKWDIHRVHIRYLSVRPPRNSRKSATQDFYTFEKDDKNRRFKRVKGKEFNIDDIRRTN